MHNNPLKQTDDENEDTMFFGDSTEAHVTGSEDADVAYGSAFYLQESYLERLRRQHRGTERPEHPTREANPIAPSSPQTDDLFVHPNVQPRFFQLGHDFPMVPSTSLPVDDAWAVGGDAATDIILPIVSPTSRLVRSAARGSPALVAYRRLEEIERATRAAMDTSGSDLARLLRKGEAGQSFGSDGPNAHKRSRTEDGTQTMTLAHDPDTQREEEEEEEEKLRRRIRRETALLAGPSSAHAAAPMEPQGRRLLDADATAAQQRREAAARRREAKLESVRAAQTALAAAAVADGDGFAAQRAATLAMRRRLPIHRCRDELLRCVGENAVTIVVGETGSGKTTQLVQYLHARGFARGGGLIGCTQPRRLAAIGVARRVSAEMGVSLGTLVGYAIHLDDTTTEETQIKFMTDGVLLREIVRDPDVRRYSVIVLDEAHERSVNTDVLLGVLKAAVRRRSDLKLVVTSATMDIMKFSRFFGNAPCYEIPGQTYDVELRYTSAPVEDYVAEAVFRVCQLHAQMPLEGKHDILVFMTGRDDVHGVCELIRRRLLELDAALLDTLLVLPCLSEAANTSAGVLDEAPPGVRKCVVATNVAETSLTIDGIRYVVDCGFMKTNVFRPKLGMNTLQRYPVSRAQADQRKGRAGRTTEGVCFRLYTDEQYQHEMLASSVPEIQRSSIDSVVLLLKSIGVTRLAEFDFMDPPPPANIRRSMWQLWILGLVGDDGSITDDGRRVLDFPLAPSLAKMIVAGSVRGCAVEAVRVASMITADPKALFELPKDREETARQHHSRFYVNDSDHLTLLNVMTHFMEQGKSRQWAKDHFLHAPTLIRACEVQEQLLDRLRQLRMPITSCGSKGLDSVRRCVAEGFCLQSARRSGTNWSEYRPMLNAGVTCYVHPSSAVCARAEMPLYVVYNDLLLTTREYLVMVTAVESDWLVEASRGVFCVKGTRPQLYQDNMNHEDQIEKKVTPLAATPTTLGATAEALAAPRPTALLAAKSKSMVSSKRRTNI